ncbi:histidine kinase osmosensor [Marasmius sp. AFHP31]|nr:histidine kinase osmosensor [Marasmius sp. AFHP31]
MITASRILDFSMGSEAGTPGSPLVVVSGGALATAAMESSLSAVEELRLLKAQVQDVARVCKAVADGDLSQKITQGHYQYYGRYRSTNSDNSQRKLLVSLKKSVRKAKSAVKLSFSTSKVRSIAKVTKAVALGDLSKQIEVDARGEILDLKNNVNGMVVRLRALAAEVTRATLEVGSQGKLGGQANVPNVKGVWFELVRNANRMCFSITDPVRSIAIVTTAVAGGDLTQKIEMQVEGEVATLKKTVNNMVDQLGASASEVTRVTLEVGTQGILGGQARVKGVQGTWADLTKNFNKMASNLTNQVRSISEVTKAVAQGNLSKFVEVDVQGEMLDLKETVNSMVSQLSTFSNEVTRVSLEVGTEGILGGQAFVPDVQGEWKSLADNVNLMAMNLTNQVRSIAEVTKAVASGDLTKKIVVDVIVKGEIANLKETVNEMTESLSVFADEVTRVAREVGTEGKLGGQARVANVAGAWKALKALTDNVNVMANNLTLQVQTIAVATTAVAWGDLTQKIVGVSVSGEMLNLVNTINDMIDQLSIFAVEVKKATREVGTEEKLGVQPKVGNVQGIWQEITLSVNTMAGNLTTQVRGFAQISAAAMDGDFTVSLLVHDVHLSLLSSLDFAFARTPPSLIPPHPSVDLIIARLSAFDAGQNIQQNELQLPQPNGRSNDYTSVSNTNYYFDVAAPHFSGALARFSAFLHCPLLSPSSTTRGLKAVDSEYKLKHQLDTRRLYMLERSLSKMGHPYRVFGEALRRKAKESKGKGELPEKEDDSDDSPEG